MLKQIQLLYGLSLGLNPKTLKLYGFSLGPTVSGFSGKLQSQHGDFEPEIGASMDFYRLKQGSIV